MVSRNTTLTVVLTGDASQLRRVLGGAERDLSTLDRASGQTARNVSGSFASLQSGYLGLTATIAGVAAAVGTAQAVMRGSITAASNLAEQQNKVNVVFGTSAGVVNDFAKSASTSLAMSSREALQATGTFGNLFTAIGQSQQSAAGMSIEMTKLAADLSSFNNVPIAEALAALQSGIVGEIEPMRRFGVAINAAAVESKALELGLAATKAEITESDKVMARFQLILEGTKNAQGDMARTMDSFANQQRQFTALWEEAQAAIGRRFLPVATSALEVINRTLQPTSDLSMAVSGMARAYDNLTTALMGIPGAAAVAEGAMQSFMNATLPGLSILLDGIERLADWERGKQNAESSRKFAAALSGDEEAAFGGRTAGPLAPVNPALGGMGSVAASQSLLDAIGKVTPEQDAKNSEASQAARNELERLAFVGREASDAIKGAGGAAAALKDTMEPGLITEARNLQMAHKMMEEAELAAAEGAKKLAEATEESARRMREGLSFIEGLNRQGVQRYAPGVFETITGAFGLNTNFDAPTPALDVAVP